MSNDDLTDALAGHINLVIKALLVAGRQGQPAEGRIPFNPLYFNLLRFLRRRGTARPSEMAEDMAVPRTTISTAVKALAKRGLVVTAPDKSDGRAISVALSEEGNAVLDAILRQDLRNAQAMLHVLDGDERAAFVRAFGKIAAAISAPPSVP